ncbi:MAG TPA: ABC-F family ATP-binding cassette domain-containing protein [Candidatus Polarisedimenticolaceae bacterium]
MIQLAGIQRRHGPRVLFDGLTWLIPRAARLGFVGPNGAGKTTLLRILAGQETPDAGEVHRAGTVTVGYLPQEVETFADGSVLATVLDGFGELRRIEEELESLERRMASLGPGDPDLARATASYGDARHRFEAMGGDEVEAKARAILTGLGVPPDRFHEPLARLSGGWRMRVVLARLLLGRPDLLLLDEPTNHLDLEAIAWLEGFLETYEGAFVVVSHDRYFLNRMVSGIVELERGKLTHWPGNYDAYLEERAAREERLEEGAKRQAKEIARVERFIERFRYKASKAKQVQSRIKALEKVERIAAPSGVSQIRFGFPPAPRSGDIAVRVEGVAKAFGDRVVYRDANLLLRRGDRVALVGPNGAGKSTLLKLLAGRLQPDAGIADLGHNVIPQYYAQHQLDALDPKATVLEEIEKAASEDTRTRLRSILGRFLFSGDDVDKLVGVLSGGEKARVALAKMLIRPSNLLLLDEPTNHLDLRSREVLEEALDEFGGTLVVVSHDRYFINRIATSIAACGNGTIDLYPGDYDTFLERPTAAPEGAEDGAGGAKRDRDAERDAKRLEAEERNRRYREKKAAEAKLAPVEGEIAKLEARLKELEASQTDPAVYESPEKAKAVGREKAEVESKLSRLYDEWERVAGGLL